MRHFYIFLLFICLPVWSKASAYWMEIKGTGELGETVRIQLIYGNIDDFGVRHRQTGKELVLAGEFKFSLVEPGGNKIPLKLLLKEDCWEASFVPHNKGTYSILGLNNTHPVVDRLKIGGENVLPVDYLCSRYKVGSESENLMPVSDLDILVSTGGKVVTVRAFKDHALVQKGTRLRVFNPQNWEKELILNENGSAVFSTTMSGMYIIRVDDVDHKAGKYQGIPYTSIRYRCNYCLFVE